MLLATGIADETTSVDPTVVEQVEAEDPSEVSDSSFKGDCTVKAVTPQSSPQKVSVPGEEQPIVGKDLFLFILCVCFILNLASNRF